jgi:hypothetical protein
VLYRVAAALIVVFWIAMTTLLLRSEFAPAQSRMREIPPAHVLKLLFLHQQSSELSIQYQGNPVGRLHVQPQVRREDGSRVIEFVGNALFHLPGVARERMSWDGAVEMTRELAVREVRVGFNLRGAERYRVEVTHDVAANRGRYELKLGDTSVSARDYSFDAAGRAALLREAEAAPQLVAMIQAAIQSAGPQEPLAIAARQGTLDFQGEPIETTLVSFSQGKQSLLEVHVNQLGQVMRAETLLGYTLVPE